MAYAVVQMRENASLFHLQVETSQGRHTANVWVLESIRSDLQSWSFYFILSRYVTFSILNKLSGNQFPELLICNM